MNDTYQTRATLLTRLKLAEDDSAWEEFFQFYKPFICATIQRFGINSADCDDILQQVSVKLWKVLPDFDYNDRAGKFRNWLYTVVKNITVSFLTQQKYTENLKSQIDTESDEQRQTELEEIIEDEWEKHVSAVAFKNIAKKVKPEAIDAFKAAMENEPSEETAKRLGIADSTVYVYRMRVKNALIAEINNIRDMME